MALGQRQPLVLWIDDAQWSDEGSGALIKELLSAPEAPAMLLLITYRSEEHTADAPLAVLDAPGARTAVETIDMPLGPLSEEETLALIGRLIAEDVAAGETRLEHLARHPLPTRRCRHTCNWAICCKRACKGSPRRRAAF